MKNDQLTDMMEYTFLFFTFMCFNPMIAFALPFPARTPPKLVLVK